MTFWVAGHLTGGLGNRLFQHAAAMGLAEKWGYPCVFYLPAAAPTNHGPFESIFQLFPTVPIVQDIIPYKVLSEPVGHVFTYTSFSDTPLQESCLVDGWRQSESYFPSKGIHVSFDTAIPKERQTALLQKYGLDTQSSTTGLLHIRLGDYTILPHHQMDVGSYVLRASKHFEKGSRFLVFSDEAQKYRSMLEEFTKAIGHTPVVVDEPNELEALYLMSHCGGGAIVANSTFSWWGAYFARQRFGDSYKALYPRVWGAGLPPARDIIPTWGVAIDSG